MNNSELRTYNYGCPGGEADRASAGTTLTYDLEKVNGQRVTHQGLETMPPKQPLELTTQSQETGPGLHLMRADYPLNTYECKL